MKGSGGRDSLPGMEPGPDRARKELREEMESHIAHMVDELVDGGADPDEARSRAEATFGDPDRYGRQVRSQARRSTLMRGWTAFWDGLVQDLRLGLRQLRRSPGFAAAVILTLTLGIGATTAIVGVVRAVVLDPLPLGDPEELVFMEMVTPEGSDFSVSEPAFVDWDRELERTGQVMALTRRGAILRDPGRPRTVTRGLVNAGALSVLGVAPVLGREFSDAEDRPGDPAAVALVSHALWQDAFAGSPDILGRSMDLDGVRYEVVGVAPPALDEVFGEMPVLTPLGADPAGDRGDHELDVVGRLAPGATFEDARAELRSLAGIQSRTYREDRDWSARMTPLKEVIVGPRTLQAGWVLIGACGILLLMACGNVSNLLLARASTRRTELAVRGALGADRGRLTRQLLTESALLAGMGGALGVGLSALLVPWVRSLGGGRIPRIENAVVDPTLLGIAVGATALVTLLVGWTPGIITRTGGDAPGVAGGSRGGTDGSRRIRRTLVVGQIAASVVLLVGTGLLLRSFSSLSRVEIGFDTSDRYVFSLSMPDAAYPWYERADLLAGIEAAVAAEPGIEAVGATAVEPFAGYALANSVARADRMPERSSGFPSVMWRPVTPSYFEAAGVTTLAGRTFLDSDYSEGMETVPVVIDRRLAETLFEGGADAVDATLVWGNRQGSLLRVTGVVESIRDVGLADDVPGMVYRLHRDIPWAQMTLVVRSPSPPQQVLKAVQRGVAQAAPGIPLPSGRTLSDAVERALVGPRFNAVILGAFGLLGLVLSLIGIYGLATWEVRQRFREFGIRLSLGARPEAIRSMVLADGARIAAWGLALGIPGAWLAGRLLDSLLFGVGTGDPVTWLAVGAVLVAGMASAQLVPARQATRVDPVQVLKGE